MTDYVFRFVPDGERAAFQPDGHVGAPPGAFVPSSRDEHVSVWDCDLASRGEAWAIRLADAAQAGRPQPAAGTAYELNAHAIAEVAQTHGHKMTLQSDPRTDTDLPGRDGHMLITGLKRPKGVPARVYNLVREDLARRCQPYGTCGRCRP